jgi:hypothetical protein
MKCLPQDRLLQPLTNLAFNPALMMVRIISNMCFFISFSDKCDEIYGFNNNSNYTPFKLYSYIFNANTTKDNYLVYKYSPENFVE